MPRHIQRPPQRQMRAPGWFDHHQMRAVEMRVGQTGQQPRDRQGIVVKPRPATRNPQPATRRSRWALRTSIPAKYLKSPKLVLPCIGAIMPLHQSRPLRKARHGHATDGTESQGCARPKPTLWGRRPPSPHIPKLGQFKDKRNMQGCAFVAPLPLNRPGENFRPYSQTNHR